MSSIRARWTVPARLLALAALLVLGALLAKPVCARVLPGPLAAAVLYDEVPWRVILKWAPWSGPPVWSEWVSTDAFEDPWGRPYRLRYLRGTRPLTYDVRSCGPNGVFLDADDVLLGDPQTDATALARLLKDLPEAGVLGAFTAIWLALLAGCRPLRARSLPAEAVLCLGVGLLPGLAVGFVGRRFFHSAAGLQEAFQGVVSLNLSVSLTFAVFVGCLFHLVRSPQPVDASQSSDNPTAPPGDPEPPPTAAKGGE